MALKVDLKPHEKIIIGSCVITNTDQRARLLIEGERTPVLREKDILTPATADTPAKLIYLAVQLMYISPDPQQHHAVYFDLMRHVLSTEPGTAAMIGAINDCILIGDYYRSLKE
jgi:flagellar protein FlbT